MGRFNEFLQKSLSNVKETLFRFPPVFFYFPLITVLISLKIEKVFPDSAQTLNRLIFSAIFGALFSIASQFVCERFKMLKPLKWYLYGSSLVLSALYYLFLTSPNKVDGYMLVRIFVISFALIAFFLWIPSYKNRQAFPGIALIYFKSFFISALYTMILILGFQAIYFAIDLLLVKLDYNIPQHIFNVFGTFFFPIYFLSLLPSFNSEERSMVEKYETAARYPQFLEVLISYIAIPLIAAFTGVLLVYFFKIIITFKWPVGELGPMVLGYSAVGLILYVLSGKLENRFASFYRAYFPFALIPLVCLQLYSVFIRVNAYGITESRYYLILFGIYSIVCAVFLLRLKGKGHAAIVILAACFAIVSIIPPTDAFTISRLSQSSRVLAILDHNDMLSDGKIVPNSKISDTDKVELTNIMNYLYRMDHITSLECLPTNYEPKDFQKVFGFSEYYKPVTLARGSVSNLYAGADTQMPMDISGYKVMLRTPFFNNVNVNDEKNYVKDISFNMDEKTYTLKTDCSAKDNVIFTICDPADNQLETVSLKAPLKKFLESGSLNTKDLYPPSALTIDSDGDNLRMRIVILYVNLRWTGKTSFEDINGEALILIGENIK